MTGSTLIPRRPSSRYRWPYWVILGIAAVVVLVGLIIYANRYANRTEDCDARGGVMVRTTFGWTCVQPAPPRGTP